MEASAGQKHRVVRFYRHSMQTFGDSPRFQLALKILARDATLETDKYFGAWRSFGDEPHFRLWLSAKPGRGSRRRMHLHRECFPRVQNFDEDRKAVNVRTRHTEQIFRMMFHQPAKVFAGQWTVGDDADSFGAIGDFPRLADGNIGRQRLGVEPLQIAAAPDALLKDGMKNKWVKHSRMNFALTLALLKFIELLGQSCRGGQLRFRWFPNRP